jgi:hypothetical protein
MDKYEALIKKMEESGEVPEWALEEVKTTYEASGLRTDLKKLREDFSKVAEENTSLRTGLLADRFKSLGITISPSILNIPSDLPVTDPDKVQSWAEEMGLIAKTETTTTDERSVHDRIATASNEGGNTGLPSTNDLDPSKMSESEFYEKARLIEAARTK